MGSDDLHYTYQRRNAAGKAVVLPFLINAHSLLSALPFIQRYPEDKENLKLMEEYNSNILKALEETAKNKDPFWKKK